MLPSITTTLDPGIICFQHCSSKVFCFNLPQVCPTCKCPLIEKDLKLLPFRLPYPFIKAWQHPCTIVLRPTTGDFLNEYNNSMDLHIAVTNSRGIIVEFDQNGLQQSGCGSQSAWSQSLMVETIPEPWHDLWDEVLKQISNQSNWSVEHYNEEKYNCYTFVLKFLEALSYDKLSQAAKSKTVFCEKYIVPRTTTAGKYISLYRKIRDHSIYTHPAKDTKQSSPNASTNSIKDETDSGNRNLSPRKFKLCTIEE